MTRTGRGLDGDALVRLLSPGQFVVMEPDMSEFVCADLAQMLPKVSDCERRGIEPIVRWRQADGRVVQHWGRPPSGWGVEGTAPA